MPQLHAGLIHDVAEGEVLAHVVAGQVLELEPDACPVAPVAVVHHLGRMRDPAAADLDARDLLV